MSVHVPIPETRIDATGMRFALVGSRWNDVVTSQLLDGATDCLQRHGAAMADALIVRVPGSWELPLAAQKIAAGKKHDAIIALGALIRGETPHFDVLAAEVASGLAHVALENSVPVIFGVLTTNNLDQALDRAGGKAGNKGSEAALSAIEMVDLFRRMA